VVSVLSHDVLEDLFETNAMNNNVRLRKQSDACYFQSTQVSHGDVPLDGAVIIRPDFPLSPLRRSASVLPVHSDCHSMFTSPAIYSSGELCSAAAVVTVTAANSRPKMTVTDFTETRLGLRVASAEWSGVSIPSAVYDKVQDLFWNTEFTQNRLPDKFSTSSDSSIKQQSRQSNELVSEVEEVACTAAASCVADLSPLASSYVDAGRVAFVAADVNLLPQASVINATEMHDITESVEDYGIVDVRSLRNSSDVFAPPGVVQSSQSPSEGVHVKSTCSSGSASSGPSPFVKRKLRAPADVSVAPLSGTKRKRSLLPKDNKHESDVLYMRAKKSKEANKKRRLFKPDMLMEEADGEEHSKHSCSDARGTVSNDDADTWKRAAKKFLQPVLSDGSSSCKIIVSSHEMLHHVPVAALASTSQAADCSQISGKPSSASVANQSCQNSVDVTRITTETVARTGLSSRGVTLLQCSGSEVLADDRCNMLKHVQIVKCDPQTDPGIRSGIDTEHDVAAVLPMSTSSQPLPGNRLVTESVSGVFVPNSAAAADDISLSVNNLCSSRVSACDEGPVHCAIRELSDNERVESVIAVESPQLEASNMMLPAYETESGRNDSGVEKNVVNTETSSAVTTVVRSASHRCNNNILADHYPKTDTVASKRRKNVTEVGESLDSRSSCNTPDPMTAPVSLLTDSSTDVVHCPLRQSTSLNELSRPSCSVAGDSKYISFGSTVDSSSHGSSAHETGIGGDHSWHLQNEKPNLSRKKLQKQKSTTTRELKANDADHNENIVIVSDNDSSLHRHCAAETESEEGAGTSSGHTTNGSNSQSLLCGQKQPDGSYCLPDVAASLSRVSAIGTPFPRSHSCSLQCRERCRVAEESLGCRRSVKPDDVSCVGDNSGHLRQSKRCLPTELSVAGGTLAASELSPPVSDSISAQSKQSTNGSSRLTLPTPKNSLTCYQPPTTLATTAPVSDSSLVSVASQLQPDYAAIQVLPFYRF